LKASFVAGLIFGAVNPLLAGTLPGTEAAPDKTATLTPITDWSLFRSSVWGTDLSDAGKRVTTDPQGNVYVLAEAESPMADGDGDRDLAVLKLDPAGDQLLAGVLIGGTSSEYGTGLAADAAGDVYVSANSWSFDKANTPENEGFPLTDNAYFPSEENAPHAVFFKLNSEMDTLLYSSRFPNAEAGGIAVDSNGFVYLTGLTGNRLPSTPGVLQPESTCGWSGAPFLAKFDLTKSGPDSLVFATYLTGNGCGNGVDVKTDADGNAYVTGLAVAPGMPVTPNAPQPNFGGHPLGDVFVMKVSADGKQRLFSTYLGGPFDENITALAVDKKRNIYVTGWAYTTFPTTPGSVQPEYNPGDCEPGQGTTVCSDAFVTKYNADGSLAYSTYLGGTLWDNAQDITADDDGNAYVTGQSMSLNFPLVHPLTDRQGGSRDAFVTVLNPNGSKILFSTMFGGDGDDIASGVAMDPAKRSVYVVGTTESDSFQLKDPLVLQDLPGSSAEKAFNGDIFFAKIDLSADAPPPPARPGDVNGDDAVNIVDATLTLRIAVGLLNPTPAQLQAADANGDGKITILDATKILRLAVGLG
jgi:hypothetical protein